MEQNNINAIFLLTTIKEYNNNSLFKFFDKFDEYIPTALFAKMDFIIFFNRALSIEDNELIYGYIKTKKNIDNYFNIKIETIHIDVIDDIYVTNNKCNKNDDYVPELGLTHGPNYMFFNAIDKYLEHEIILLLETDTFVISDNWIDIIDASIKNKNFIICGSKFIFAYTHEYIPYREHLNGVAVYKRNKLCLQLINDAKNKILYCVKNNVSNTMAYDIALSISIFEAKQGHLAFDIDEILNLSPQCFKPYSIEQCLQIKNKCVLIHKKY